jgi:hypothetical protein
VESIEPLLMLSSLFNLPILPSILALVFSISCALNFSKASSMNDSGTFFCHTLILPMYSTSKKLLELGDMSTHSEVKLAALLTERVGGWWFWSFICLYRSDTVFSEM